MKSIYVAYTPYHILLSCGIARTCDDAEKKYLFIVHDFADAEKLYAAVKGWAGSPFAGVWLLAGDHYAKRKGMSSAVRASSGNMPFLKSFYRDEINGPAVVHIFNDNKPESQLLASLGNRRGGTTIFVEDGIIVYWDQVYPDIRFLHKLILKAFWGPGYRHIRVFGTHPLIRKRMVFYPESLRPELRDGRENTRIPKEALTSLDSGLVRGLLDQYGVSREAIDSCCLVLLPHTDVARVLGMEPLRKLYDTAVRTAVTRFGSVSIKYHPRETAGDYLGLGTIPGVKILPNALPVEVLYAATAADPPMAVIDDISTALLTARMMYPDRVQIISLMKALQVPAQFAATEKVFGLVGIAMPARTDEIAGLMR